MCHTAQRRRVAGGQQEEKKRGSRWRGQGGGGDVCQEGWLGSMLGGTDGIKSLSGIRPFFFFFFNLCLLISHFLHHICSHYVLFFPPFFSLHALISAPLHHSTFFSLLPDAFSKRPPTALALHGKRAWQDVCASTVHITLAYQERVSITDGGTVCQGDGAALNPRPAEQHGDGLPPPPRFTVGKSLKLDRNSPRDQPVRLNIQPLLFEKRRSAKPVLERRNPAGFFTCDQAEKP